MSTVITTSQIAPMARRISAATSEATAEFIVKSAYVTTSAMAISMNGRAGINMLLMMDDRFIFHQ
jgi:hypothetical protein